ncbi:ankyrin repeat domain-containing protein [Mesoflavibacter profundi]|uniref:ankyrin repeat domain-containing protein n=1 Tax=Mesoflavibacter profundi TaxID=2708110 RepID=UPI003514F4E8
MKKKIAMYNFKFKTNYLIRTTLIISCLFFNYNVYSQTDIFEISRTGSIEDIETLYSKDKNLINQKNEQGYTPLTIACYNGNSNVALFLADKVEDINGNSKFGTPLMAATYKGYDNIVKILLDNNAKTNLQDSQGATAMHYAVLFRNYKIIELLVNSNADFSIKNNVGKSAMDFAISYNDDTLNKLLNINKN